MGIIELHKDERLQWLRFVLNPKQPLPEIQDWQGLFEFTQKQAVSGICSPTRFDEARLDSAVLYEWIWTVEHLKAQNLLLNKRAIDVVAKLKEAGFRCCILKGQGNATMYPVPEQRTPGDIDIWVDANQDELYAYVKTLYPQENESFKHIKFPMFNDTEIDIHYTPLKLYHPVHNKRLQQWIESNKERQMTHYVRLAGTDTDIAIPTVEFNAVYQMVHILIHLMDEGIGMRHMVDYYYVLKALTYRSIVQRETVRSVLREIGMMRLAAAVMWVEYKVLGLSRDSLLTSPNERLGTVILEDIMEGGNFGHHSSRQEYRNFGRYTKKCADTWHLVKLLPCFPGEAFFKLLSKIRTLFMSLLKNLKIKCTCLKK